MRDPLERACLHVVASHILVAAVFITAFVLVESRRAAVEKVVEAKIHEAEITCMPDDQPQPQLHTQEQRYQFMPYEGDPLQTRSREVTRQ